MLLVDVHAHLDMTEFDIDLGEVMTRAKNVGVTAIIANGIDPKSNREVAKLAKTHPIIKPAFGFYPVHVAEQGLVALEKELSWIRTQKPIALGEVGLDYKKGDDNPHGDAYKEIQKKGFLQIIRCAKEMDVPIIVHTRKAEDDVLDLLEKENCSKVVLHCFMGKKRQVERAAKLGYTFSVPVIVVKLQQLQWLVQNVPLKQLLTETDAPYLSPISGKRNEPSNVLLSVQKIAELLGLEAKETAYNIYMNYQHLF